MCFRWICIFSGGGRTDKGIICFFYVFHLNPEVSKESPKLIAFHEFFRPSVICQVVWLPASQRDPWYPLPGDRFLTQEGRLSIPHIYLIFP